MTALPDCAGESATGLQACCITANGSAHRRRWLRTHRTLVPELRMFRCVGRLVLSHTFALASKGLICLAYQLLLCNNCILRRSVNSSASLSYFRNASAAAVTA